MAQSISALAKHKREIGHAGVNHLLVLGVFGVFGVCTRFVVGLMRWAFARGLLLLYILPRPGRRPAEPPKLFHSVLEGLDISISHLRAAAGGIPPRPSGRRPR